MDKTIADAYNPYLSLGRLDVIVLLVTAPFLLAPTLFPPVVSGFALLLLFVPFIVRPARGEQLSRPTAANLPVAILGLIFLPVALLTSPAPWAITWVRITILAWSISLFFTIVNSLPLGSGPNLRTRLAKPTQIYLGLGALTAVVGLLGMRSVDKLFFIPQTGILVNAMGWENGLPTNEIAGVLTLFIPFTVSLIYGCWVANRRHHILPLALLMLLMSGTLVLAQSRTAFVATAVGTVVGLVMSGSISKRWVIGGSVVAALGLLIVPMTPLMDWFVFAGANSWASVIDPRLGIWGQAFDGIRDHPLWGMGFGVFGSLARLVYPLVSPENGPLLEDAHNLYLQTALDFGLVGLLVFLIIGGVVAVSAIRLMQDRPPRSLGRLWAAGLFGSFIAHALYSLTDAVALGTLAGVPVWFLFGLVMSAPHPRTRVSWSRPARLLFGVSVALVILMSLVAYPVNRAGHLAVRALADPLSDPLETAIDIGRLAEGNCRAQWYEGLSYHIAGDSIGRAAAWEALLACSEDYTGYMSVLAAGDAELAQLAITSRPEDAAGYFWLAEMIANEAPAEAIALYRRGLSIAPHEGRRWLALAVLLRPIDETAALDAYLQACRNGDPGANGCLGAGSLAESQGDIQAAIEYLRLSRFSDALAKADELERRLNDGP